MTQCKPPLAFDKLKYHISRNNALRPQMDADMQIHPFEHFRKDLLFTMGWGVVHFGPVVRSASQT